MTPQVASQFATTGALLSMGYTVFAIVILAAVFAFIAGLGERLFGLDLRGLVDNVENAAKTGDVWPAVIAFFVVPACLFGLILFIGLH